MIMAPGAEIPMLETKKSTGVSMCTREFVVPAYAPSGVLPGPTQASSCLAKPDSGQCFIRAMCGVVFVIAGCMRLWCGCICTVVPCNQRARHAHTGPVFNLDAAFKSRACGADTAIQSPTAGRPPGGLLWCADPAAWARVAVAGTANAHMRVGHDIILSMITDWNARLHFSYGLVCVL